MRDNIFLSTPSARRATSRQSSCCWCSSYFYPRPPRGGRPAEDSANRILITFLSTPSARRATRRRRTGTVQCEISIHALREEGDQGGDGEGYTGTTFLSTPSARRATLNPEQCEVLLHEFLSTPSARRATGAAPHGEQSGCNFYPRPPRGGRPILSESIRERDNFYPRPPRGGRQRRRPANG